jgi:hypothetical protein
VPNASDDLPDPETPVNITSASQGMCKRPTKAADDGQALRTRLASLIRMSGEYLSCRIHVLRLFMHMDLGHEFLRRSNP